MTKRIDADDVMRPQGWRLSEALSKDHTVSALLALERNPGLSFTRLGIQMGGIPHSGRPMAEHLRRFGLVTVATRPGPFGRDAYSVELTPSGRELARGLRRLLEFVPDHVD